MTVAADEAPNEGGAPKYVGHRADVEAGQARVADRIIEHGYTTCESLNVEGLHRVRVVGEGRKYHHAILLTI